MAPERHPDLASVAFLLGTWRGEGEGDYPTTEPFRYREELRFEHVGDAFLLYTQWSWDMDGSPLHFERGIVRPVGSDRVEFVLAHVQGVAEIAEGTVGEGTIETTSTSISRASTGDPVVALTRRYVVTGDRLRSEVAMETDGTPLTFHVRSELRRAP